MYEDICRNDNYDFIVLIICQLKSQVRCVECGYVSVRFDPFTFLSLPLPMDNSIYVEVIGESFVIKTQILRYVYRVYVPITVDSGEGMCNYCSLDVAIIVYCTFCPM